MNGFGKRLVSMLLALVMVLSMMPVTAFTARGEENTATEPAAVATEPVETQEAEDSWQKYNLVDHLQSLPDNFCCSTNLWACLTPEEVMINHLGEWVKAGKTVYSITIQINPGDRIYANSFVEKGIQVSFIGEYGIVKTLFSADTKKAFQANGGYLIAPEGSIAVNIPVWDVNDENNTVNILNYDHVQGVVKVEATCTEDGYIKTGCLYCEQGEISDVVKAAGHSEVIQPGVTATCAEDGLTEGRYCDVCDQILVPQEVIPAGHKILEREAIIPSVDATGLTAGLQCSTCGTALVEQEKLPAVVQLKDYLRGMYVSVLGDSISTYLGVSNDTDRNTHTAGNVAGYRDGGYYANDDVTSADLTWWMQSINAFDMKLLVNHASGSGRLLTTPSNGTLPAYYDEKCLNLHDDSGNNAGMEPDIIAVYIGVNDGSGQKPAGSLAEIDFSKLIQGTSETGYQYATPITMAEGYAVMLHKMQNRYPEAEIFLFTIPRLNAPVPEYRPVIKEIAAYFGVRVVDLYDSVLTQSGYSKYFFDGVHPNAEGMKVIASLFQEELLHLAAEYHAADGHTYENGICTVCGEETPSEPMSLRYDDHVDMTEKTVEIIDAGKPTSYQVGYGVEENKVFDTAVVTLEDNILVATGVGTAKVKIDGQLYEITVSAAPISLLLLIGQSNMQGIDGNPSESIVCPDGQVYATYADRYKKTVEDVTKFAPGALTGPYSNINVTGDTACLENYPVHMLTGTGNGREGMDSGLAYEWVKQTGEKVWVVNVGYGGSSITQWQKGGVHYEACLELFSACQETLRKEIAAGHFTMSNMAYFWCQGCADETQTAKWYADQFLTMHETLKTNMAFSEDVTFEFAGIIPIRSGHSWMGSYRAGVYKDTTNVPYYQSFMDLRFNGPRVAQYWMGNNPDLTDIWNVCTIQEGWATLPDGSDGVAEYFRSAYENGVVDYTTQVTQSASWYKPTTPAAVHDNIHYNQIGYNEIGREAARNALILLGEMEAPEVEAAVKFLTWDGFTPAEQITASTTGTSGTLVVPMVSPVWKSKEITYITTADLCYEYYDLLAETMRSEGKLTAVGATGAVTVAPRALTSYCWTFDGNKLVNDTSNDCTENTLVLLAGSVSGGTFSGIRYQASQSLQLLHNEAWCVEIQIADWKATSGSMLLSSSQNAKDGQPYFYFRPTDFFVGIGCYNGTTYDNYGISLKKRNIACSEGTHTYRFVNRIADDGTNMVYLFVDGQQIGTLTDHYVNSTLSDSGNTWISGKDFAMPYLGTTTAPISNCTINYLAVTETGYDPDAHFHRFSEWETVREPSVEGPGEEKRTCACGETDTREVEGVWQTLKLSEHMTAMPDEYCCATNLWTAMEHDKYYFATNSSWSIHHTGTVYSVTIPINAGDQIFATSFGAAGDNGGAKNGIITTFFNADGVEKILMPADTYAEFVNNGGYLVAPENTVAANLVMWTNSDKNELYLLNRDHTYENGVCSICGAEHPSLANYEGKVVSILGDSISTFAGYIPVADGFNLEHLARYPQDNLLTDVHETWWMQVIHAVDAKLGINDSWRGATVSGAAPVTTGTTGENAAMHNLTRIQNLGSNGTPDVILFYGGTNDLAHVSKVGGFDPASAPCEADLSTKKWDNLADGYVHTLLRLKHFYPEAQIVALLPTYTASYYSNAKLAQANAVLAEICDHYDVAWVDLRDCGITTAELPDGIHPDAKGMDYITDAVLTALAEQCSVKPGESKVYSVTHELRGVTASLGHYKGISAGKIFAEKLTGENMAVTVTMGGADITEACYDAGQICIENVTGDIVVIAEAKFSLGDQLQQLPENLCYGVNLWPVLRHDTDYYSVNGWVAHSSGKVRSVTIPVAAGEKIYASSFGAASKNGSTTNGIRVTFFSEDGMLITMGAPEVYAEFTVNGYLTAPESAVAVSIPMWTDDSGWELYLLSRKHNYENGICTGCGDLQETITHKQWTMSLDSVTFLNYYVNLTGFADGVDFAKQGGVVIWNGDVAPSKADQMQVGFENCRVTEGMFYNEEYGWCVKSHEIYAKNLGDMVYMRPFVEVAEGVYVYGEARYYSPELYCRDMLANERNRYDTRRVCAALLEYGAAAQQYFDYKVDDLVNEGLTLQKKYNLAYDSSYLDNIKLTDHVRTLAGTLSGKRENVEYGRSTLSLQGAIRISAGFNIDGTVIDWEKVKKAEVLFWTEERIAEVDSLAYELHNYTYSHELRPKTMADKVELGDYRTLSDHIQAKNLGEVLFYSCRIEMEDDSVFCSGLVYYSPEAFLNDHLKNSTGEIVTLCERIAVYGEMARLRFS